MAFFLVNSARQTESGTVNNDQFVVVDGANRNTLQGLDGNDRFDFLSFNSGYNYGNAFVNGNGGQDTINIRVATAAGIGGSFFGGGADKDLIVLRFDSGEFFIGNTIQGGAGNDKIVFSAGTAERFSEVTINGNAGDDVINLSSMAFSGHLGSRLHDVLVGGGQGMDVIDVRITADQSAAIQSFSIAGGQGIDVINFNLETMTANGVVINGGTLNTDDNLDGGDFIQVSASVWLNSSIIGNRGNDLIIFNSNDDLTSERVLIAGNDGNDTLITTGEGIFQGVTIGGGKGDDFILSNTADGFTGGQNSIIGGAGNDTIAFEGASGFSANMGLTMEGGAGADLFIADDARTAVKTGDGEALNGGDFRYNSLSDSVLGLSDTIAVTTGSGSFNLIMPDNVQVFNGRLNNTDFFFTGGILEESGDFSSNLNLSQMVAVLNANLQTGDAVGFRTKTALNTSQNAGYVFVKGGDDDLLVTFQVTTGFSANNTELRNPGSNVLMLDLNT